MSDRTCSVEGCDKTRRSLGMCPMHYQRLRRLGEVGPAGFLPAKAREAAQCGAPGCERDAVAKGLCNRHYENRRLYGHLIPVREWSLRKRMQSTGWTVTDKGCWEWNGKRNDQGYGIVHAARHGLDSARAHRVMFELNAGPIPDGMVIRHRCDNPPCVNPDHLQVGTQRDNARDMSIRGRHQFAGRTECVNGHDLTEPGALKVVVQRGRKPYNACVRCEANRKMRFAMRKRAA
jgi:hypothetical protein